MSKNVLAMVMAAVALLAVTSPLVAHHGAATFDTANEMTLKGTVTEWTWFNPRLLTFELRPVQIILYDEDRRACWGHVLNNAISTPECA